MKNALGDKSLIEMMEEIRVVAEASGFYEMTRTIWDDIALLHTEIGEMHDAFRDGGLYDQTGKPAEGRTLPKPEGVPAELADVFIRTLDLMGRNHLDVAEDLDISIMALQCSYVWKMGPVGSPETISKDIALLHRALAEATNSVLTTATIDGPFTDVISSGRSRQVRLQRTIGTFLSMVFGFAHAYGIDIKAEYERKMAYNRTREHRHGKKVM